MADRGKRKSGASRRGTVEGQPRRGTSSRKVAGAKNVSGMKKPGVKIPVHEKGPPWNVIFHPQALGEKEALKKENADDHEAVVQVMAYLRIHGPGLTFPHQSAVQGEAGKGLRELRPTQGRTLVRPLYRRFENLYVILAIGPEAQVDRPGFNQAVEDAQARRRAIEDAN